MRKNQKGFTLVELLVVIAILAILATVAVVGYSSFIESANESNDKTLVGQLNKLIQLEQIDNSDINLVEAINVLEENGVDIDDIINPESESNKILWDDAKKCFIIVDENDALVYGPNGYALNTDKKSVYYTFVTGSEMPTSELGYSIYWLLSENIKREDKLELTENIVIDGNGKTLTVTSGEEAVNVNADGVFVGIIDLTVDATQSGIGLDVRKSNTNISLSNVSITAKTYAINVRGAVDKFNIKIEDSTVTGYAAIQVYGDNGNIDVNHSTLNGVNVYPDSDQGGNDFATIVFGINKNDNIYSSNVNITVTNSDISAEEKNTAKQYYTSFQHYEKQDTNCNIVLNNCKLLTDNAKLYEQESSYPDGVNNKLIIDGEVK